MNIYVRILIGTAFTALGVYGVMRTTVIQDFFGTVEWADRKLGGGGSNLFYKLISVGVILIGFIVMTNMWQSFLESTLGSILPHSRTQSSVAPSEEETEE